MNREPKGSQPANRDLDKIRRQWRERSRRYAEKHKSPVQTIGNVPKLAEGAINPMWATEESIKKLLKHNWRKLRTSAPKKKKTISTVYSHRIKDIDIEEEEEYYALYVPQDP